MYNEREKAKRDYEWGMAAAREEGRQEGLEEARRERVELAILVGKTRALQNYLGDTESPTADLLSRSAAELSALLTDLQERLRSRGVEDRRVRRPDHPRA